MRGFELLGIRSCGPHPDLASSSFSDKLSVVSTAPKVPFPGLAAGIPPKRTPHGAVILDRPATIADLDQLPPTWRGEVIEGTLYAFPHPGVPHQLVSGAISVDLRIPFGRGRGGPGGWRIFFRVPVQVHEINEISPDISGWRRERLPILPQEDAISIVPDWICEVQSPSTRGYDIGIKRRFYASIGVSYIWYVDPFARTLLASRLHDGHWLEIGAWRDDEKVRVEPFEAIELDLSTWWEGVAVGDRDEPSPPPPSTSL